MEEKVFTTDFIFTELNIKSNRKMYKIIEMSLSGSGIRDIARVLKISTDTVISELKKKGKSSRFGEFRTPQIFGTY